MPGVRFRASDGSTVTVPVTVASDPPQDPAAWGYRPPVPAGWTLVENQQVSIPAGASRRYYRGCRGGFYLNGDTAYNDLIFVDCDFKGATCGTSGPGTAQQTNLQFYGCRFGGVNTPDDNGRDAIQIKPRTSGGTRPRGWLFQGCTFEDVTRTGSGHTDGIQFGGVLDMTVRHCYFENVAVEMILCNGWNGNPENVLVEACYFGSRPSAGGPPVHFSKAGGFAARNCRAVNCFSDGVVAVIETGTTGCSQSGTRPRSEWTRGNPWLTY